MAGTRRWRCMVGTGLSMTDWCEEVHQYTDRKAIRTRAAFVRRRPGLFFNGEAETFRAMVPGRGGPPGRLLCTRPGGRLPDAELAPQGSPSRSRFGLIQ